MSFMCFRFCNCVWEVSQFEEAWRYISEAMTTVETTKESWYEAEVNRIAGEIALMTPKPDAAKAQLQSWNGKLLGRGGR
jgi:hypothetical protein